MIFLSKKKAGSKTAVCLSILCGIPAVAPIMATVPGVGWNVAGSIAGTIAAEGNPLYATLMQYKSIENYHPVRRS